MSDELQDLLDAIKRVEDARPYFEDKDKNYLCVTSRDLSPDYINLLDYYRNMSVKQIDASYFPDKNSIYIISQEFQEVKSMVIEAVVREVIIDYGKKHGYDGLYAEGECACIWDDIAPCCGSVIDCRFGYRHDDPNDEFEFIVSDEKPNRGTSQ